MVEDGSEKGGPKGERYTIRDWQKMSFGKKEALIAKGKGKNNTPPIYGYEYEDTKDGKRTVYHTFGDMRNGSWRLRDEPHWWKKWITDPSMDLKKEERELMFGLLKRMQFIRKYTVVGKRQWWPWKEYETLSQDGSGGQWIENEQAKVINGNKAFQSRAIMIEYEEWMSDSKYPEWDQEIQCFFVLHLLVSLSAFSVSCACAQFMEREGSVPSFVGRLQN